MFEELIDALNQMIERKLSEVNTSAPGVVVSYDAAKNRAVVRPSMPKRLAEDDPLAPPPIVEVPITWPASNGGKSSFTHPLQPGDGVMLSFQQRSLENWLGGNNGIPDDPRQFDLSDCVAVPGCAPTGIVADPNDVVLKFNQSEVRITNDNVIHIGNSNGGITLDQDGNMTLRARSIAISTPANSFILETHKHPQGSDSHGDSEVPTDQPLAGS